jgi:hypothetical protein
LGKKRFLKLISEGELIIICNNTWHLRNMNKYYRIGFQPGQNCGVGGCFLISHPYPGALSPPEAARSIDGDILKVRSITSGDRRHM